MAAGFDQALNPHTVLLAGASSQVGIFAIPRLLEAGYGVFAVSRSGPPTGFPDFANVHWLSEAEAISRAPACRYLLSAGPMDLAMRLLEAGGNLRRAVICSSTSVETKRSSRDRDERELSARMLDQEASLRSSADRRGVKLSILRPTLVYGCGLDANVSRLAGLARRLGFIPVNGEAQGLRQPIHASDLAAVATRALASERELPGLMNVAGGETLTYAEIVRRIFRALKRRERLLRLPEWLFVFLVRVMRLVWPAMGINSEMVRRQAVDLVFDDRQARELLDHDPRPFNPDIDDFSLPDFQPD